ncbi:hypothetical protein [Erythrobacter donghaensis]|uniref:hypothetical protein n=1 Tax=Erythrobacter donghaensis TaxID=267135 RepID=UPI00093901E0|nr:hypothetical protein [Erythrobacter donghaensis]
MRQKSNVVRDRKADQRSRRRSQGFKPLEIWLPKALIARIDEMKTEDLSSRDAVIMAMIEESLRVERPSKAKEQLMLL